MAAVVDVVLRHTILTVVLFGCRLRCARRLHRTIACWIHLSRSLWVGAVERIANQKTEFDAGAGKRVTMSEMMKGVKSSCGLHDASVELP